MQVLTKEFLELKAATDVRIQVLEARSSEDQGTVFDIMFNQFARFTPLHTTPRTPCGVLYFVPILTEC